MFSDNVFILFYILILQFQGTGLLESITHHYETISHDFNTTLAVADDETKSDLYIGRELWPQPRLKYWSYQIMIRSIKVKV